MESSFDQAIQDSQESKAAGGGRKSPSKPPGGKALLRLLDFLESRGCSEAAQAAVDVAIQGNRKAEFHAWRSQYSAAPGTVPKARGTAVAKRGAKRKKTDSDMSAASIAEAYMAAASGPPTGPPTAIGPQWRSLGPWTIPNGQTYGASRVNVSGRISAIATDPNNAAHVLCGAANGGVWESFNRGASWAPRTDYAATLTVGAIAFDRAAPANVYCGTGEGNWWSFLGAGILKSTDGGTTWTTLCTAPFIGQGFYDLVVDPANGQHLLAATNGGLYVSTDGGVSWTQRRAVNTWSISMAPAGGPSSEILAACSDGIFQSVDGGATWTKATLPGSPAGFDRLAVSMSPSNTSIAYAWGANGATAYLYRRSPRLFPRRSPPVWTAQPVPPGVSTGQAWYDWYCAASPDNANQVYLGAIESYRGDLAGATWTWITISNKGASGSSIHPDQHAIAFESGNPNMIYVGCDGGLFLSADRGINWIHCNNGLVITEFEYLAQQFGTSRWIIGGTQDNGTERYDGSPIWTHAADGDGGDCAVNRTTPSTVFHTYFNMSPERSTSNGDFGSWSWLPPPVPSGEGSLFYPPLEASAAGGDIVAIGGGALYVSRNNMTAWTRIAFPSTATASAAYIPNANTIYVGVTDGRFFKTTWDGAAWTALTALTTPRAGAGVSDILVNPNNANQIWVTYSAFTGGRVYRSDNGGSSWIDRTPGTTALPINAIEIDPWNTNRLWVAADLGIFQTLDGGATWVDYSASLPNAFIGDVIFHPHARVLRAGTRNRGVWEIPVDGWMTTPICGVQWNGVLNPNQTQKWFTFNWPATWHVIWTVMPTTIKAGAPEITWSVQVERAGPEFVTYWITVQNLTSVTVTFEGRYCILSRY